MPRPMFPTVVTYVAAFEDDQGLYVEPQGFSDPDKALLDVEKRNQHEVNRMSSGVKPDTVWFILKAETRYNLYSRPALPKQTRSLVRSEPPVKAVTPKKKVTVKKKAEPKNA